MIDLGSLLMIYNIVRYIQFELRVSRRGDWGKQKYLLLTPLALLILFFIGYVLVRFLDSPDILVASILLGGSIFVFLITLIIGKITDKIQENEHLEAALMAAEQSSRAKTFFLSNMSHDIRTPLNAIIGFTHLGRQQGVSKEDMLGYLEKIEGAGNSLLSIINDVLDMSRIESGKMELKPLPTDIHALFRDTHEMFQSQMQKKSIQFILDAECRHDWVLCDKNRLGRVLLNLISNACKFTPEKGQITLSLRETEESEESALYIISVRDNGIGMSKEFLSHIFEPFERERTSTVSGIQGTGLGMAIIKSIVDMMEGSIEVNSSQGQGTEVICRIRFPFAKPASADAETEDKRELSFTGKHLLLVEDNEINRQIAVLILKEAGFILDTAENGAEAVEIIRAASPGTYDAILMDIQMPVMDGYEATLSIRNLSEGRGSVPIIAMTANAFSEDVEKAQNAGMNAHISKPIDVQQMLSTIQTVLGRK